MLEPIHAYSDIFIKYLFGSPENNVYLLSFLNSVQEYHGFPNLVTAEVLNPFNLQEAAFDKLSILDIKAKDETGRLYNIEVQANSEPAYLKRSLYYWAKLYAGQLAESDPYEQLQPTISINIVNFVLFPETKAAENCFLLTLKGNSEYVLTDHIVMHYIELPKIP